MRGKYIILIAIAMVVVQGCELDNYAAPDASLYGTIVDIENGQPIESDIYNGTVLNYYEEGYVGLQSGIVKCDGTYNIGQMFSGRYKVIPIQTNFEPIDTVLVEVNGKTKLDLEVKPYIRISNVSILKSGSTKVTATFTVAPSSKFFSVQKVGLFVHQQSSVGAYLCQDSREISAGGDPFTSKTFKIVFDYTESIDVKPGRSYYFRVGALAGEPNARYNYAPAVQIEL